MFVKLFVLGRPGSGKTTASYRIKERAEEKGWAVNRVRDYNILRNMFKDDVEKKKFRATAHNGFDVVDFSVLDTALLEVERFVKLRMLTTVGKEFTIVEFARDDYKIALDIFSPDFLQDTHILFVDAKMDICRKRIYERIKRDGEPDNHFISDTIMKKYYGYDNSEYMKYLADFSTLSIEKENNNACMIKYIENTGSLDNLYKGVDRFFDAMMMQCSLSAPLQNIPYLIKTIDEASGVRQFQRNK